MTATEIRYTIVERTKHAEILLGPLGFHAQCMDGCGWASDLEHARFKARQAAEQHDAEHDAEPRVVTVADAVRHLRERGESYARDAVRFRDAKRLGKPITGADEDEHWATVYQVLADELAKVSEGLRVAALAAALA